MALDTSDLSPFTGTEVKLGKDALLSCEHVAELRALLDKRGVLLFRNVELSDEEEVDFAATLGTVRQDFGRPIMRVTFDREKNPDHYEYFDATFHWHMDGTHDDYPPLASIVTPRVLPPPGTGQTEFVNAYASWDDLPEEDKRLLEGLTSAHTQAFALPLEGKPTEAQLARVERLGVRLQPAVWQHRNGRKSLALGASVEWFDGMNRAESDALTARMLAWMTQPKYVYRHEWRAGDVLIWDNTGVLHRALPYDKSSGRRLHRVTLVGEEPLAKAA
jgi:alpha-ketoglutarate-dependent taurine dioxygenase